MNRQIIVLAISLAFAATSAAADDHSSCPGPPLSELPCVVRSHLAVNEANEMRYVMSATESEGINQILQLLQQSDLEEHWAFLPHADLWVETGFNEITTPDVAQVEVDTAYLVELAGRFQRINLYHFHPRGMLGRDMSLATPLSELTASERHSVVEAVPGYADIIASFEIGWLLEESGVGAEVRHFLVSQFGTVEFGPTPAGRREFGTARYQPLAQSHHDFAVVASVRQGSFNVEKILEANPAHSVADLINELCHQIPISGYRMSYSPINLTTILVASP